MAAAFDDSKVSAVPVAGNGACQHSGVCVLDDDPSILRALQRLLTSAGFEIETFTEPSTFLSSVAKRACRVAILDVWMPKMNGLEVQAVLRKGAPETRVIFLSGLNDPSIRETALAAGAVGFLSKPFDDETLVQLVRTAAAG